ncbi:ABC transporter permease [Sulfurospirillum sp.]|nr:ABC transporter permease [Sulfurospirillum sp.]
MSKYLSFGLFVLGVFTFMFILMNYTEVGTYNEDVIYLIKEHLILVGVSGSFAIVFGVFFGVLLSRPIFSKQAENIMQVFNISVTVPTLAVLALSMSFLGIGFLPSVVGLFIATLLPIIKNSFVGLNAVDRHMIEAARGMGMSSMQILFQVEIPNAMYVIFSGIRTALAINVGTAPLVFLIGGGGLGELIFSGIDLDMMPMLLAGAITTGVLAILVDKITYLVSTFMISKGVIPEDE